MKQYIFLMLILFPLLAQSAGIELQFSKERVKQGSLEQAVLRMDAQTAQAVEVQKLKGQSLGDTIYVYAVSPLLRKNGGSQFEADATVIFLKVPEAKSLIHKSAAGDLLVSWSSLEVIPTEAPKDFLFGTFEVPDRKQLLRWFLLLAGLALASVLAFKFHKKWKLKQELKRKKALVKQEIVSATAFEEIVFLWQKKQFLIKEFPHIEEPLKELESVLFKYQFKPKQTEPEKTEVLKAYADFVSKVQGGFRGV